MSFKHESNALSTQPPVPPMGVTWQIQLNDLCTAEMRVVATIIVVLSLSKLLFYSNCNSGTKII